MGGTAAAILNICPVFYTIPLPPFLEAAEELKLYCLILDFFFPSEIPGVALQPCLPAHCSLSSTERLCLSLAHHSASVAHDSTTLRALHEFLSIHWMCFQSPLNLSSYLCTSFGQTVSPHQSISQTNLISVLATASSFKPHGRLVFPQRPSLPVPSPNSLSSLYTVISCDSLVKWYLLSFLMTCLKGISFQEASCHLNLIYYASSSLA